MRIYIKQYKYITDLNNKNILIFNKEKNKIYYGVCQISNCITSTYIGTIYAKKFFRDGIFVNNTTTFSIIKESFIELEFFIINNDSSLKMLDSVQNEKDFLKLIDNIYITK